MFNGFYFRKLPLPIHTWPWPILRHKVDFIYTQIERIILEKKYKNVDLKSPKQSRIACSRHFKLFGLDVGNEVSS